MPEISCRITNTFLQYVKKNRPELLKPLLEGLPYTQEHLMDQDNWITWDVERLLEERLIYLFDDEMIMFKIGQSVVDAEIVGHGEHTHQPLHNTGTPYQICSQDCTIFYKRPCPYQCH